MSKGNEYRFAIGNVVISLVCQPPGLADFLSDWFAVPTITNKPDIQFEFEVVPHNDIPIMPNSLLRTKITSSDGGFDISDGLFFGSFDPTTNRGLIKAKGTLLKGLLPRVLEQIFYQAYYSAPQTSREDSFLVHSSAVIADGGGYLFVGPSEAGKSTVAACSSAYQVINDEMNLIHLTDNGPFVEGTLFNGTYKEKKAGKAPLRAIFTLSHQAHHKVVPTYLPDAVTTLAAELVPQLGLSDDINPQTIPIQVDTAAKILDIVPVRTLEFEPNPGFWPEILAEFTQ